MRTTAYPSTDAWRAQIGSTSVTYVTQPAFFNAEAQPLPTSPKPQEGALAREHDIGGTHEGVGERVL